MLSCYKIWYIIAWNVFFRLTPSLNVGITLGERTGDPQLASPDHGFSVHLADNQAVLSEGSRPTDDEPGPSNMRDPNLNKSFSILSDLKTQMFRYYQRLRCRFFLILQWLVYVNPICPFPWKSVYEIGKFLLMQYYVQITKSVPHFFEYSHYIASARICEVKLIFKKMGRSDWQINTLKH